ncbi:MAG: thioredoxin family protein [Deltaproteobacteria bacterium]|nr:thioredoxin family protein [Deltaproteobacteria bacterium]
MQVQVYGTNCAPCKVMLENTQQAVRELGWPVFVENVRRIQDMLDMGITGTPALAIDGEVVVMGRALPVAEIKDLLVAAKAQPAAIP